MVRDLKIPFFTVLFIFVGLLAYTKIFGPLPFSVTSTTTTKESLFTVQGTGEVTAIPDTAIVSLGVNKQATTVEVAKQQVDQIINKITEDVKAQGVEANNIKTTNYSVNPSYDWTSGQQQLTGYQVDASIQVEVTPIDKANTVVDLATKDGATQVGGITFIVNEEKRKELQAEARKQAIAEAKEKAKALSSEADIRLGRIIDVQETDVNPVAPMRYEMSAMAKDSVEPAQTTELNPGENVITSMVTLSYETY
ncbi:MAG: SIMPL domain-containing protein [Patescibacteria group bacterium]